MFDKTSMMALGMAGAFTLGLAVGPQLNANRIAGPAPIAATVRTARPETTVKTAGPAAAPRLERVLAATAQPVQRHVKRLLNDGADVRLAAAGFSNARELMTVAHAARNTEIPFILLKHRVLDQGMSLARAIRASKPELNEDAEVNRARADAKADLARISRLS